MKAVKIVLAVLLAVFVFGLVGTYVYFATRPPTGEIVILGPGREVTVQIDDGPSVSVAAKGRHVAEVSAGSHTVTVEGEEPREVSVPEKKAMVVPVAAPQCFATLDVTLSAYDVGGQPRPPRVVRTERATQPFALTSGHYTSMADIPEKRTSGASVIVLRSASCQDIDAIAGPK